MTLWYFASYLLLPYAIASLVWRGLRYEAYWYRWPQRFGFVERMRGQRIIWVHAVSVGEVRSAAALIRALDRQYPEHRVLVTTMTPTGSDQVLELFGDRVVHTYVPYDFPDAVARFLSRVAPELAVVAETEFWPNIFNACKRRGIPLFLVNVRLSRASYEGYQWVGKTTRAMFASADLVCAQTDLDAERLGDLGVNADLIEVTGNLKFDVPVPDRLHVEARALRVQWGKDRPVLIAASTHPGEERQLLDAFEKLRETRPDLLLVIVPRHPERFAAVYRLCRKRVGRVEQRSYVTGALSPDTRVLVGDTMGELQRLYAASDVAFIGGSLVRRGGQNLLEACAVGVPVLFGPHMFHFEEISAMALERGAARQVADTNGLVAAVAAYFDDAEERRSAGRAALELVSENQGALARSMALVTAKLDARGLLAPAPPAPEP
jgi:3-deoxy-D-manno-octulosonic-acid transferase